MTSPQTSPSASTRADVSTRGSVSKPADKLEAISPETVGMVLTALTALWRLWEHWKANR